VKRSPFHQPPNPDDLRRVPPTGPVCARFRGMMRDFADGDMAPADRFAVEEHVHACHVCAVELARAEHEVMRLRRGYAEVRRAEAATTKGPRPGFAARVVQRLIDEEGSEANETGRESADTALRLSRLAHQRSRLAAPLWLAAAAMMLFVVSGTVALLFREQDRAPEHTARCG
jgi:hypothetical protein